MSVHALARYPFLDDEPTLRDPRPWHVRPSELPFADSQMATLAPPVRRKPRPVESLESLSMPEGISEHSLPAGTAPRDPYEARVWLVRLARELGRKYREWYGVELRTDAMAVERMQWHLTKAVASSARYEERGTARELVRHGLVLGEILVRALGGGWMDLAGDRPGKWELFVPPSGAVRPVVRVQRFVQQGMCETDLVALFLELDAAQR